MSKKHHFLLSNLMAGILLLVSNTVQGAGFAIIEQSASGQGNAYAGAAATASDASTIFYNPAGMSRIKGNQIVTAGHIIIPRFEFTNNGTTSAVGAMPGVANDDGGVLAFVPNFYYVRDLNNGMKFGIGIFAPFGLSTKYDANWVGRYQAIESSIKTLNINPSIAWQATPKLSLGAGISLQYMDARLTSAVDFAVACYGTFGAANANCNAAGLGPANTASSGATGYSDNQGDDWGWGFNLGLLYQITPDTRVGVAYRSKIRHKITGRGDFTLAPNLLSAGSNTETNTLRAVFADSDISVNVKLPDMLSLSVYHQVNQRLAVMADITRTRWSSIPELRLVFANAAKSDSVETLNWKDANRYSIGLTWRHSKHLTLRSGIAYDQTPVPNATSRTARLPDNNRTWLSFGLTWKRTPNLTIDAGYSHLFIKDTPINRTGALNDTIRGSYDSAVDIVAVQVQWKF